MTRQLLLFSLCFSISFIINASSSEPPKKSGTESSDQELSLQQDRAELDKLRKDIPEDVKRENDDMAFILKLFEDKKRKPSKIKRQFDKAYNRIRKKKQKEFKRERKEFTRIEKSQRKKSIAEAKKKRKEYLDSKPTKDDKKTFFDDERTKRKEYFSDEKEKRRDFESDLRARKKESDDFLRDRRKEFSDRLRQFKKDQKELKEMEKKLKKNRGKSPAATGISNQLSPENEQYLKDFEKIPRKGGQKLKPAEEK